MRIWGLSEAYLRRFWGVFEAFLSRIWGVSEAYLRRIWGLFETYLRRISDWQWGVSEAYLRRINWNCSNSVSFHAICLKFFSVGPLKISLQVLAFSELCWRLPIATFTMLVCFCKIVYTANVFYFQFWTFPTLFNVNNLLSNLDWPNLTRVVELVFSATFSTFHVFSLLLTHLT